MLLALATVLTLIAPAPRAQVRDSARATGGTAVISGTVISDGSEPRPVRRVRVTCNGGDRPMTTISDDRGRFVFSGLKAGRYTIHGAKDAWVSSTYRAKRPMRPGSPIPVADGQKIDIRLTMIHGSVVTGVLLDVNNQPAANTTVNAMHYVMQNGSRRLEVMSSATTDDRGVYRIYGLAPGDYYIGAAPALSMRETQSSELRLIDERTRAERTVGLSPTYFPGTPYATQAAAITLGPGQEREGIDFAMQIVPTARVDGSVTTAEGVPAPPGTSVVLITGSQTAFPGSAFAELRSTRVGADGAFAFADVAPGTYTVLARGGPPLTWAATEIAIDGDNVTGLALGLQPGMTMAGQVKFDGVRLKPPSEFSAIRVTLQPVQGQGAINFAPSNATVDVSGRFEITGIIPGAYRLTASMPGLGRQGNWFLRSTLVKGQDTLDFPIAVRPGESISDTTIVISDRPAQLSGTVQNALGGAPNEFTVILFPTDQALWQPQSRRIQAVRPAADGGFAFHGLPPGEYLIAAIDDVEPGEWFDPAFLQRLLAPAMKITIGEGENKVQDIRLGGGHQHTELPAYRETEETVADREAAGFPAGRPRQAQ